MRPEGSLCEYKMILVSIREPEVIPWFRASRRVAVAAIFVEGWGSRLSFFEAVYTTPDLPYLENAPKRADMSVEISGA